MKYTPAYIKELKPNQVIVFGSNLEGRHGAGLARACLKWGAIYGVSKGRQGKTYAIPTKDLRKGIRSISLEDIKGHINTLINYCEEHKEIEFLMTMIGCGLAGYTAEEISELFPLDIPNNLILPKQFADNIKKRRKE